MPHLVIRGITVEKVKEVSLPLVAELAEICGCGTDNFTLEVPSAVFVFEGREIPPFPLIEVKWFERSQDVQDRFAQAVTKYIKAAGADEVEVAFVPFSAAAYYINGSKCEG